MGRARIAGVVAALAIAGAWGCGQRSGRAQKDGGDRVPFRLTANRGDFLLEWVDGAGDFQTGTKVADVPEAFRAKVRIEPLSLPPSRRAPPDRVYLADLRRPGPDGVYPVRVVPREEFEALSRVLSSPLPPLHASKRPVPTPMPAEPQPGAGTGGAPDVIVYGASWCGACRQAEAWLRSHGIAYVDKDIERDPAARAEMQAKCRAAGVSPTSIPILDVKGRILQGFSPSILGRLLRG